MFRYAQTHLQLDRQLARGVPDADRVRVARVYQAATHWFTGQFRASGRPFLAHLVGTASILAEHGAPPDLVVAGLAHAIYDQGRLGTRRRGATRRNRALLRAVAGDAAEALVHAYPSVHATTWEGADAAARLARLTPVQRQAAWIAVANELEESLDLGLLVEGRSRAAIGLRGLEAALALAHALGAPGLAQEIRDGLAATRAAAVPAALRADRDASYTLHPPGVARRATHALLDRWRRSARC
jgi:(p)ppGpp synthase/HD superfamily hydrolase